MIECPSLNASSDHIDAITFIAHVKLAMDQMDVVKGILK